MKPVIIAWTLGTFWMLMLASSICDYYGIFK